MKSAVCILASIFCTGAPLVAQVPTPNATVQTVSNHFLQGKEVVQTLHADYNAGKYSDFLKSMDQDYRKAKKSNDLEGLIEIRKESAKTQIHPDFAKSYRKIQDAKNKELLKLAEGNKDSEFATKLQSAAASMTDIDSRLIELNYKAPGTGANSDENALIEISLEYYYKAIHLDSLAVNSTMADRKEKHMALELEKMDKMLAASKSFTDKKLQTAVEDSAAVLDARMARSYDMSDLLALSKGKVKPASSIEEKSAAIISNSQGQLAELHRQLLNSVV